MKELFEAHKVKISYFGILISFILAGNNNNTPESFIERIFKPITIGDTTFYYSGIILMVIIYFSLKLLYEEKEYKFINSFITRLITTIVLINVFSVIWFFCIQFYKSFYNDLNSIYLNRYETSVDLLGEDDKLFVRGNIDLRNCSDGEQEFYIKIKLPSIMKEDINREYVILKDKVKISPKENKKIFIDEELDFGRNSKDLSYNCGAYEYILFNNNHEVIFRGELMDYRFDNTKG